MLTRNPATLAGFVIVVGLLMVAAIGPLIAPFPESGEGSSAGTDRLVGPSRTHPFGTDSLGRDIFSRVLIGARISVRIVLLTVTTSAAVGVAIGIIAGFYGGWVDEWLMRLTDLFLSIPALILAMLIATTLGGGIENTILAIAVTWWPRYARLARGETLRLRASAFVESARAIGAPEFRILRLYLFPNIVPLITIQASLDSGASILTASALGFIGLGAKPPSPEWGLMVAVGREWLPDFWWLSTFPGLAIFVVALGFNILGDGLRAALDPRMTGSQ
jgi:peptide/nickel transport system permease protein